MSNLHDFLQSTFSGRNELTPSTGFLHGTKTHVSLTHDNFSIFVKLIPDINYREKVVSSLFVDGVQYDAEGEVFGSISDDPFLLQSYSILSIIEDLEMLFEMGLLRSHDLVLSEEREIMPLRAEGAFSGNFDQTEEATRAFHFLAVAGLRKVAIEEVFTLNEPWDIYSIAAESGHENLKSSIIAIAVAIIQTSTPIILAVRGFYNEKSDLMFVVYITRVLFVVYAVFYELKLQSDFSDQARLVVFLSMLPEFHHYRLLAGIFINLIAKVSLSLGIIILLQFSYSVIDVTLNALALYFILDIDNYLVSATTLDKFRNQQEDKLFRMKFISSRYYSTRDLDEPQDWTFQNWPFYAKVIKGIHFASFTVITIGALFIIISPFVFGDFTS